MHVDVIILSLCYHVIILSCHVHIDVILSCYHVSCYHVMLSRCHVMLIVIILSSCHVDRYHIVMLSSCRMFVGMMFMLSCYHITCSCLFSVLDVEKAVAHKYKRRSRQRTSVPTAESSNAVTAASSTTLPSTSTHLTVTLSSTSISTSPPSSAHSSPRVRSDSFISDSTDSSSESDNRRPRFHSDHGDNESRVGASSRTRVETGRNEISTTLVKDDILSHARPLQLQIVENHFSGDHF